MKKSYKWTTPRGAKIEATITVEHITRKTVSADGWDMEVSCNEWYRRVDAITVNGKPTKRKELWTEGNTRCILIDMIGKDRLLVALPKEVEEDIYGEEREVNRKAHERAVEIEKQLDDQRRAVEKMMNP